MEVSNTHGQPTNLGKDNTIVGVLNKCIINGERNEWYSKKSNKSSCTGMVYTHDSLSTGAEVAVLSLRVLCVLSGGSLEPFL